MISPVSTTAAQALSPATSNSSYAAAEPSDASFAAQLAQAAQPSDAEKNAAFARQVTSDFEKWVHTMTASGISADYRRNLEKNSAAFEDIVGKAAAQGGYDDPQAFLKTLSASELEALQHIHSLADPIQPDGLTKEGALNLLYAPDQTKDIDKDGFEMVGVAKTWRFPPPDAPASVKQAWDKTVSGMQGQGALLLSSAFLPVVDPRTGQAVNAALGPDTDYVALARKALGGAIVSSRYDQPWQTETRSREIAGLRTFLANLQGA